VQRKNFSTPDEVRKFDNGHLDMVTIDGHAIGRATFLPGWKWSTDIKPIAKTDWCEAPHFGYQLSGMMHVLMADGEEMITSEGDIVNIPMNHDAWVVGDEPVIVLDWAGFGNYAL
jgi:hypothetical protein